MANLAAGIPCPSHAYVPGLNARHPEDWFDPIKDTARPGMDADALGQSRALVVGLAYLDAGYFWECHEVLEAVWMALPDGAPERAMVQAIIQLANARLKLKMNRPRAVLRLCDIVEGHLADARCANPAFGLDPTIMAQSVAETRRAAI